MSDKMTRPTPDNIFKRIDLYLIGLARWQLFAIAFFAGALAVFAFAPLHMIFMLLPSFSILTLLAVRQQSWKKAFVLGWWWGSGFFSAGLYWISMALLVDAQQFAWLIPIAISGFALGFGLFVALSAAFTNKFARSSMASGALLLAASWSVLEWVRSWLLTGFPWNLIGSVWTFSDHALQAAAYIGTYGLGALTVLAASAPAALVQGRKGFAALGIILPVLLLAVGGIRLMDAPDDVHDGVRLRLVQPNISQADKWNKDLLAGHMMTQLEMGAAEPAAGKPPPTHIIWGETQAPFFVADHQPWINKISSMTPPGGLTIVGAPRKLSAGAEPFRVANSMLAIDPELNAVVASYDKFHLVPFGEYVPLADLLPMEKITKGTGAFTPGPGVTTMNLKGLPPLSPLICYEIIFPLGVANVDPKTGERPEWLLNLTNDAWYGKTQGPHQHFALSRMRSVEEGLPLVRVANTGISGVVDAYGRIVAKAPLGVRAVVDSDLPKGLGQRTVYSMFGNVLPLGLAVLMIFASQVLCKMQKRIKK